MSLIHHRIAITSAFLVMGACSSSPLSNTLSVHDESKDSAELGGLLNEYCTKCHNYTDYAGGISLENINSDNIFLDSELGEKVILRLRAGMMPPAGEARPDQGTLQALAGSLEQAIDEHSQVMPGRVGLHRLNRVEYGNAVRDLLALEINPEDLLPADDSSRGFDNQAGSLGLSPALLEAYLSAAGKISQLVVGTATSPTQTLYSVAEDANQNYRIEGLPFGTRGGIKFTHNFPAGADYNFRTFAVTLGNMGSSRPFGTVKGEKLQVLVDGEQIKVYDWDNELGVNGGFLGPSDGLRLPTIDSTFHIAAGSHEIGITFTATNYAPGLDMNNDFERSTIETGGIPGYTWYPHLGSVRIDGPYNATTRNNSSSRQAVFVCTPASAREEETCADEIIENLAELAFRGYSSEEDIASLKEFYQLGRSVGSFDSGIEMVLQRLLTSPKFIYRIENEPENLSAGEAYAISDLDLASRLSFFLWSSIPDQTLLDLAKAGELSEPQILEQQVQRMIADPRSIALSENFAGQWLALRNLSSHSPVVDKFPDFDNLLRESFRRETELLFDSLIKENRSVLEVLTADYTFVNERLAMHYGISGVKGERFRRVQLKDEMSLRRGILGKGSMLTVASQPGRTSPVIRGYWTLSNIIGVEPPPPPPDVPALEPKEGDNAGNNALPSMREQMEEHRTNPACQGCHRLMDPIGFALESFDAVGQYRTEDNGNLIDPSGELYDGSRIEKTDQLVDFLLTYEHSILRNATQKMLTYALGRGMEYDDMPLVRQVQADAAKEGFGFQALILAVIKSEAFLNNSIVENIDATLASSGGGDEDVYQ